MENDRDGVRDFPESILEKLRQRLSNCDDHTCWSVVPPRRGTGPILLTVWHGMYRGQKSNAHQRKVIVKTSTIAVH